MRDQRSGIDQAAFDQREDFSTVTAIHSTGLESEILSLHLRKRQSLRLVV